MKLIQNSFRKTHILSLVLIFITTLSFSQHDACRDACRFLAKGETKEALTTLDIIKKKSNSPTSLAEKWYVTTLIYCQENNIEKAYESAMKAVENGLPAERFLVEPRELLSNLHKYAPFKKWINENKKMLIHGPLLGSVTSNSASFWFRTADEAEIKVKLTEQGTTKEILSDAFVTSSKSDFTTVVKVESLKPNTKYDYQFYINGELQANKSAFITFPEENSPAKFQIAFGGGAGYTEKNERMWNTINSFNPIATLLLGDNVYIDDPEHQLTQQYCYYRRQSRPEFRNYVATNSIFSIYDDHDFGDNDCIPGPQIDSPSWKRDVWNTFKNNWANPAYGGGEKNPGCWYSFYIGEVHFIMLDTRYYRDLDNENMLSDFQKNWLMETLKTSKGKFKVLVSSVPWSPGVKPGSKDTWDGFENNREEIFSFIEKNRIEGVVLMSADRHRSDLRRIPRANGYSLYEMMSSRLTNVHVHDLMEKAKGSEFIMGYNNDCSFGLVEFDTEKREPEMTYEIINIDGDITDKRTIKLSKLKF
jgi:alkaline phosphatase D